MKSLAGKLINHPFIELDRDNWPAMQADKRESQKKSQTMPIRVSRLFLSPKAELPTLAPLPRKSSSVPKPRPHPLNFILHVFSVSFGVAGVTDLLLTTCSIGIVYNVAGVVIWYVLRTLPSQNHPTLPPPPRFNRA